MENQNKRSFQRGTASAGRSQSSSRPIRTTASYMHAEKKAEPAEENARRSKKPRRSRSKQNENAAKKNIPWKKLLMAAGALVVVLAILALIFGTEPKVVHQMPKVTPPESVEESL